MNEKFNKAISFVLAIEGGLCEDSGGLTKYGISQNAFPNLDIKKLTREKAMGIYHTSYWEPMHCDAFPEYIATAIFDAAVNHGKHKAGEMFQSSVNSFLRPENQIAVDGRIGAHTIAASDAVGKIFGYEKLYFQFVARRLAEYVYIGKKAKYEVYLRGWVNRIVKLINFNNQKGVKKCII